MTMTERLRRVLPFLNWPRPDAALLRAEAWAGLAVGLMVIPQGVAYAALAGMPPITGIYASILPALVAALFSASPRLSVGPTALTCLLVGAGLEGLATPGSVRWVWLAMWLALFSGVLQVALGFMRFGWLLNLVNAPILTAFTHAAAVLIISSQIPDLLGAVGWQALWTHGWHAVHLPALLYGAGSIVLLVLARRWRPSFPSVLLVVLGAAWLSWQQDYAATGGQVVGLLPAGLPKLMLPDPPSWQDLQALILPTLVITLVSFLETASSAKVDNERSGARWDQDQDLIGQGLGKMASGLCGAFPTSSSFSRSALNLYAGARTGWATVFSAIVVLLALWVLLPVLRHVPQSVLAAIVVVAVYGLLKPREFVRLWRVARAEAIIALLTFVITLATAPQLYWGVMAGVLMSLSHFLNRRLHPRIIEAGLHPDGSLRDRHLWRLPVLGPDTFALRMDADLDFAAAAEFERRITEFLATHPETRHVCLFAQPIGHADSTGIDTFLKLQRQLREHGVTLHISGMKLPVEQALLRAGWRADDAGQCLYRTEAETVAALKAL